MKTTDADFADIFPPAMDDDYDEAYDDVPVPAEPEAEIPEADDVDYDEYDGYLLAEIKLMRNGVESMGKVVARTTNENGERIGKANANPMLDDRVYDIEFLMVQQILTRRISLLSPCFHRLMTKADPLLSYRTLWTTARTALPLQAMTSTSLTTEAANESGERRLAGR